MMSFDELPEIKDKIKIVVNRVGLDNGQISLKKAQETIGREIYWQLPNDYRVMVEVRNNGVPLIEQAPRAAITQAMVALAKLSAAKVQATSQPRAKAIKPPASAAGSISGQARLPPRPRRRNSAIQAAHGRSYFHAGSVGHFVIARSPTLPHPQSLPPRYRSAV